VRREAGAKIDLWRKNHNSMYGIQADDGELGGKKGKKKRRLFIISTPHERSMRVTWGI